jgi:hypothetical protein
VGALAVIVLLPFVAFLLRGGLVLRVCGWVFLAAGVFAPFSPRGNVGYALVYLVTGAVLWLAGHWAYAFAYYHYKSSRAERVIEHGIFPLVHARGGQYRAQGPVSSALRDTGVKISRLILRSASGVDKVRPPADVSDQVSAGERDATRPSLGEVGRSRLSEGVVSVRERIGVSNRSYERVRESLAKEQALGAELRTQLDVLEARARAREGRLSAMLADAATFVDGLDRSILAIAAQLAANRVASEEEIAAALQAMLAGRVRSVEISRVEQLSAELCALVRERGGVTTWMSEEADDAGEHRLESAAALAGQRAILVTYADGVYDDGLLVGLVEQLCHAVVASLESRDLAREKGRRLPISLLGDAHAYRRLAALRDAQGSPSVRIVVRLDEDAYEQLTGVFGESAWSAELFTLASELDGAARSLGGEVFEIGNEFVCLVAPAQHAELRERFDAIVERTSLRAEVRET